MKIKPGNNNMVIFSQDLRFATASLIQISNYIEHNRMVRKSTTDNKKDCHLRSTVQMCNDADFSDQILNSQRFKRKCINQELGSALPERRGGVSYWAVP